MLTPVKAMVFDAYGTLLNINSLDEILAEYFGDKSQQLSLSWRRKQLEYTWLRTLMGRYKPFSEVTMDALTHSCRSLGLNINAEIRDRLYKEYLQLAAYPEVSKVLQRLSGKISLGILSNANQLMLEGAVERNRLSGVFAHIISVEDISKFKPRPEVYQLACHRFGLNPEQILFVTANTWDAAGAKSFGLKVAWLNRFAGVPEELDQQFDYMVEDMNQLADIVS